MYCNQPYTVPRAHTTRPIMRMLVPVSEPSKNVTWERSGMRISASRARRREGTVVANAAAPHLRVGRRFIGVEGSASAGTGVRARQGGDFGSCALIVCACHKPRDL